VTKAGARALAAGEDPVAAVSESPPDPGDISEIAHWIAPEFLEVRFDARFFAVRAPESLEARPDEVEVDLAWWATPAGILKEHELWMSLMWPTYVTLTELERCRTVEDVLSLRMEQVAPPLKGT
jgi:hypothetical protein